MGSPVIVDTWGLTAKYDPSFLIASRRRRWCSGNKDSVIHRRRWRTEDLSGLHVDPAKVKIHIFTILEVVEEVWRVRRPTTGMRECRRRAERRRSDRVCGQCPTGERGQASGCKGWGGSEGSPGGRGGESPRFLGHGFIDLQWATHYLWASRVLRLLKIGDPIKGPGYMAESYDIHPSNQKKTKEVSGVQYVGGLE